MSEINKALIKARADIHNPHFDSENPHFRSKFASLKAVIEATIPVFAQHGIAVVQDLQTIEGGIGCFTHLLHESGEEKKFGPLVIRPTKPDAQGEASASTYARRYHLMTVCGVVGDVDDDGNAAASQSAFKSKQAKTKARGAVRAAAVEREHDQLRALWNSMDSDQIADLWNSFAKADRDLIKEGLEKTKEAA